MVSMLCRLTSLSIKKSGCAAVRLCIERANPALLARLGRLATAASTVPLSGWPSGAST